MLHNEVIAQRLTCSSMPSSNLGQFKQQLFASYTMFKANKSKKLHGAFILCICHCLKGKVIPQALHLRKS